MERPSVPIPRPSARVVLLDRDGRIFLFCYRSPRDGSRWWITPGGGVDAGESYEEAALRELREETGLTPVELGPCLWTRDHVIPWLDERYLMQERFYLVPLSPGDHLVDVSGLDAVENEVLIDHRWWTVEEIEASEGTFAPERLASLLRPILEGSVPSAPVDLGGAENAPAETTPARRSER